MLDVTNQRQFCSHPLHVPSSFLRLCSEKQIFCALDSLRTASCTTLGARNAYVHRHMHSKGAPGKDKRTFVEDQYCLNMLNKPITCCFPLLVQLLMLLVQLLQLHDKGLCFMSSQHYGSWFCMQHGKVTRLISGCSHCNSQT